MVVSLLVPNQMRYQAALRPDAIVMSNNTGLFNSRKENKMIQIGNFSYSRWELIGSFVWGMCGGCDPTICATRKSYHFFKFLEAYINNQQKDKR